MHVHVRVHVHVHVHVQADIEISINYILDLSCLVLCGLCMMVSLTFVILVSTVTTCSAMGGSDTMEQHLDNKKSLIMAS